MELYCAPEESYIEDYIKCHHQTHFGTWMAITSSSWNIVIHGGIDDYSRLITYLRVSTNNLASTVLSAFKNMGSPLVFELTRENVLVSQYLLEYPERVLEEIVFLLELVSIRRSSLLQLEVT